MSGSSRIAVFLVLASAAGTGILYALVRPTPPERMKQYSAAIALRLSANAITGIGAAIALAAGVLAAIGEWGWAAVLLVFGSWCDLIDGEIARTTQTEGKAGAFLDSNLDRLSEIALFAGLAASFPDRAGSFWAVAALASSLMVSYARARGEGLGVECPNFGMERPHRVVLLMFAMLFAPLMPARAGVLVVEGACAVIAVGAAATALGRMVVIHHRLRRIEEQRGADGGSGPGATR